MASSDKKDKKNQKKDKKVTVKPSDKKEKDIRNKAKLLIMKHPEALNNARKKFRNENGITIPEEVVPRGDSDQKEEIMPRNQGDLNEMDLRGLAVNAMSLVDQTLSQYDKRVAYEDALNKAIWSKDAGKYSNRVNYNTFSLILSYMDSLKTAADNNEEEKSYWKKMKENKRQQKTEEGAEEEDNQRKKTEKTEETEETEETKDKKDLGEKIRDRHQKKVKEIKKENDSSKESNMDKRVLEKEIEAMQEKLASLKSMVDETSEKEVQNPLTSALDRVASDLEAQDNEELTKLAFQIDMVSEVIEGKREASTLEGDADEKFMKQYFHAGKREGDADEKYMNEYNTDITQEVEKVASKVPYQKVNNDK